MSTLNEYLQQTQRFLRDQRQDLFNPLDLISYVNRARREVAMRGMCVRVLTPISGAVISASVVAAGSGYTSTPTITITAPDFPNGVAPDPEGAQATAAAIVQSGTIAAVDITYGGSGYFEPTASITDSTGTAASITLEISTINELTSGQEVYPFSGVSLDAFPGVESVYMIKSVSIIYSNYRYSLPCYDFSTYQAMIRQYPFQYQYVPAFCSQFGQGTNGSFYVYPLPSQNYQYELDCFCLPQDLSTNLSEEALPKPWSDAVPYFTAHLAYSEIQKYNTARYYFEMFDQMMLRYGAYARPGRATNMYGRYSWFLPVLGLLNASHFLLGNFV